MARLNRKFKAKGVRAMNIDPRHGPTAGDTPVKIRGGPWDEETVLFTVVKFGNADATNVIGDPEGRETKDGLTNYKTIIAKSPPHKAEKVSITVITPDGTNTTAKDSFSYTFNVTAVEPKEGSVGTVDDPKVFVVIITGDNFSDVVAVEFDGKPAHFGRIDRNHLWAIVPFSEKKGAVEVKITSSRGENKDKKFEYT
jgi:hypothetical protein